MVYKPDFLARALAYYLEAAKIKTLETKNNGNLKRMLIFNHRFEKLKHIKKKTFTGIIRALMHYSVL